MRITTCTILHHQSTRAESVTRHRLLPHTVDEDMCACQQGRSSSLSLRSRIGRAVFRLSPVVIKTVTRIDEAFIRIIHAFMLEILALLLVPSMRGAYK